MMFIRAVKKKNPGYEKSFVYHHLTESVRTSRGPRQRFLLDLGRLTLPRKEWKILANCIEDITTGKQWLIEPPQHIVDLAQHYAQLLIHKEMNSAPLSPEAEEDWETVDLNSVSSSKSRTIGGEAVAYHAYNKLGIPAILSELGFSQKQSEQAAVLVIGRLLYPRSERKTALWAKRISGLGEILDTNLEHLPNNALYRTSDLLQEKQREIEIRLAERERRLYSLEEKIILQGKANTRFSGSYYVRTNRHDLGEGEIWSLYMMLTQVENAFRCLKSELGLRPIYQQKDGRMEGHLFISVLAYHLMAAIVRELKRKGINHQWETIRDQMTTQVRITTAMTTEKGERVYIRQTTEPEPFHYEIHRALGILPKPLRTKRFRV